MAPKARIIKRRRTQNWGQLIRETNRYIDWLILLPAIILMILGTIMVYSASADMPTGSAFSYVFKQGIFDITGLFGVLFLFHFKFRWQTRGAQWFIRLAMTASIFLMLVAFVFGQAINGAKGWILLGPVSLQPVEFFKISLILFLAYTSGKVMNEDEAEALGVAGRRWPRIFMLIAIFGVFLDGIMPDMGGVGIITMISITIILAAKWRPIFMIASAGLLFLIYILLPNLVNWFGLENSGSYMVARLIAYINPWEVASSSGLQLINSLYAISNGGIFGRGLGNSIQKFGNLPEPNTDFIMAIVAEELGMFTILIILALLYLMIFRLITWGMRTKIMFYRLTLYGFATYFFMQVLVNFGGVVGALPITGVTFPFISYGGSSIWSLSIALGIAMNIIKQIKHEEELGKEG
ncbi:FtsW/RodA/SpoVE family cell cycle protein [Weissella muntiaci]|nr:FtsW/RodA/SpoVE family cell cycle protein [Weissella muntiaci]